MHFHNDVKNKLTDLLMPNGSFVQSTDDGGTWESGDFRLEFSENGSFDVSVLRNRAFEKSSSLLGWEFNECDICNSASMSSDWTPAKQLAYVLDKNFFEFSLSKAFCKIREDAISFAKNYALFVRRYDMSTPTWRLSYIYGEEIISCIIIELMEDKMIQFNMEHIFVDYEKDVRMSKKKAVWSGSVNDVDFSLIAKIAKKGDLELYGEDWTAVIDECGWGTSMSKEQFLEDFYSDLHHSSF